MSNKMFRKSSDVVNLSIKSADDVFEKNKLKTGVKIYGKIERDSNFIIRKNKYGKTVYVNDVYNLCDKTKRSIVDFFENHLTDKSNKRKVCYLVKSVNKKKK